VRKRILALPIAAVAAGLIAAAAPAQAHGHDMQSAMAAHPATAPVGQPVPANAKTLFLAARLSGAQEVPTPGGPAVGDPDGAATALVRVKGSQVKFSFKYNGIGAPTLGHIHQGKAGANGPIKVALFGTPMPAAVTAAVGAVTVNDPAIADAIRNDPAGFYLNLHSKEFPGGAVRGQLTPLQRKADLFKVVHGGKLHAYLSGEQEVPVAGGPAVGDPDGRAVAFIRPKGTDVGFSLAFIGVTPTLAHVHQGTFGANGPIKVVLLDAAVPASIIAVSGAVTNVDASVVQQIRRTPKDFYANLHSAEFPGGAVRGQLFR
jgi:hypothetical protein